MKKWFCELCNLLKSEDFKPCRLTTRDSMTPAVCVESQQCPEPGDAVWHPQHFEGELMACGYCSMYEQAKAKGECDQGRKFNFKQCGVLYQPPSELEDR